MNIKTKKDVIVLLICIVFLLMNIGAIGSAGRKRAKEIVCLSNLNKWGKVFEIYTNNNDGKFNTRTNDSGRWYDTICNYQNYESMGLCPMAKTLASPNAEWGYDWWGSTFLAWGKVPTWDAGGGRTVGVYGSYGVNGYIYVPGSDRIYSFNRMENFWGTPNVEGASNVPMLLDCYFWCGWPDYTDTPPSYDGERYKGDDNSMNRYCLNRHDGSINCVFMDFSARKVGLKELWTLKWHRTYNTQGPWTKAGGVMPQDWPHWMRDFQEF